jgi:hypothetical protein
MNVPSDWLAGVGTGLGVGAGMALVSHAGGAVLGAVGVAVLAYVIGNNRRGDDESDDRTVLTDGGVTRQTTPTTAATEQPVVLDVELSGDRVLARVDRGDVSVLVEAPAGIGEEELEGVLEEVPTRLERTVALFDGGDSR